MRISSSIALAIDFGLVQLAASQTISTIPTLTIYLEAPEPHSLPPVNAKLLACGKPRNPWEPPTEKDLRQMRYATLDIHELNITPEERMLRIAASIVKVMADPMGYATEWVEISKPRLRNATPQTIYCQFFDFAYYALYGSKPLPDITEEILDFDIAYRQLNMLHISWREPTALPLISPITDFYTN